MKGMTIQLINMVETGKDAWGKPIYKEEAEDIHDVLVGQPSTEEILSTTQLFGKKIEYVIGIPKGDTHDWTDRKILINGNPYCTIGYPQTGIQENIPLRWGQNVRVAKYG